MSDLAIWRDFIQRPDWFDHAACVGLDPAIFFNMGGDGRHHKTSDSSAEKRAKRICEQCPVRLECLAYGLHEDHGVWGGRSVYERRELRRLVPPPPNRSRPNTERMRDSPSTTGREPTHAHRA